MKKMILFLLLSSFVFVSCTKHVVRSVDVDVNEWMRAHERGTVVYTDAFTGNFIVETSGGYSVIESWNGSTPYDFDNVYAYFSSRGVQDIYNRTGNYFMEGRVVDSWLSWSQALYVLDQVSYKR
jgi:hypothetical protein